MARHAAVLVSLMVTAGQSSIQSSVDRGRCIGSFAVEGFSNLHLTGGGMDVASDRLTLQHNSGASVTSACLEGWDPNGFAQLHLLGHTISFEVDLSAVGCGCNLAVYLVEAPALDSAGLPSEGTCDFSPYYCDANQVCGQYCTEMDIMEANIKAFATTPHKCDASASPEYQSCDRLGHGSNSNDLPNAYGPGSEFTIDTRRPFEVRASFYGSGSEVGESASFVKTTMELVQGWSRLEIPSSADAAYLGAMAGAMARGMSMRITYWGSTAEKMSWLDTPPCGAQTCNGTNAGTASISNMRVFPITGGPPSTVPRPSPQWPRPPLGGPSWFPDLSRIPWVIVALAFLAIALGFGLSALLCCQWDCIKKELFGVGGVNRRGKRRAMREGAGESDSAEPLHDGGDMPLRSSSCPVKIPRWI